VRLLSEHERAPHRHLHFAVEHVRAGTRELPRLEVRLLDHLGRPGIVLFSAGQKQVLAAWQATGEEGGRPFMALIPSDPLGRSLLERMGTADWQLVNHLAQLVQRYLAGEESHLGVRWQTACARLCRQLADMPARLRYDRLQLSLVENDGVPELDVLFGRTSYGERVLDQVHLRWQVPDGGGTATRPPLRWLRPADPTNVPLSVWPIGEDGLLASAFALPVGHGTDARPLRQQWDALSTMDRDLLLAMLDALPGAADRTPDAALPPGASRSVLTREAAAMHKDARRTMAMLHLRDIARRFVRRIRGSM
jgi:hypothetical protein